MKKNYRRLLSVVLACAMLCLPVSQAMASNTYDVAAGLDSKKVLFPGDCITGVSAEVTLNGEAVSADGGAWTNTSEGTAYRAETSELIADDGTAQTVLALTTAGYVLTVNGGTSETNAAENGSSDNHYAFTADEQAAIAALGETKDIAYYQAGESVKIKAADPAEGFVFAGWAVSEQDAAYVTVADASSAETTITMPERAVTVTATYAEAVQEPVTEATEAPVTETTEAPVEEPTQEPVQEPTENPVEPEQPDTWETDGTNRSESEQVLPPQETIPVDEGQGGTDSGVPVGNDDSGLVITISDEYNSQETPAPETEPVTYVLTVENGTGSGSYEAGTEIDIQADDKSADGLSFDHWAYTTDAEVPEEELQETFSSLDAASAKLVMPAYAVTLTAVYTEPQSESSEESEEAQQTESTEESEEEIIPIVIDVVPDTTETPETPEQTDPTPETPGQTDPTPETPGQTDPTPETPGQTDPTPETPEQTDPTPEETDPIETDPVEPQKYELTIEHGRFSNEEQQSEYAAGDAVSVEVIAEDRSGYRFTGWTVSPEVTLTGGDSSAFQTTFTFAMPEGAVTITANYEALYTVTVANGTVGGTSAAQYAAGETVTVTANMPETGKVFSSWSITGGSITLANPVAATTTFTMPESDVALTAVYATATHSVNVTNGSGSNPSAAYGSTVSVSAQAPSGQQFVKWTGTTASGAAITFANASSETTTFTMPDEDVTITAVYEAKPNNYTVTVANGLINGSVTSLTVESGTQVTVTANSSATGQQFSKWVVNDGAYDLGSNASNASVTVTVTQNMKFQATYEGTKYAVTVKDGTANYTTCTSGTVVTLTANAPASGYVFESWHVDTGNATLADSASATTTFTMPAADVAVTAVYKQVSYTVAVENGSADKASYAAGETVTITSNYPASGKEFSAWTASSGNVTFTDSSRATTTFTMPASNVTVKATYQDGPVSYIDGIKEGESYPANEKLTFTPVGGGMSNSNPNPGDIRYVPTGYQIGNVSNSWSQAPYETSMSIKKTGEYTLKVTFTKQVWNGSTWAADGTTNTISVNFNVVTAAEAVSTGDSTPIVAVAAIAAVAIVIFIILLVVYIRRRRSSNN